MFPFCSDFDFDMSIIYPDTSIMKKAFLQFSPKHIKWSQFGHSSKRIFSEKLSASGGLRSAGGSAPRLRYRLALPRSPWEPEPPFHKSRLHPCAVRKDMGPKHFASIIRRMARSPGAKWPSNGCVFGWLGRWLDDPLKGCHYHHHHHLPGGPKEWHPFQWRQYNVI